MSFIGIPNVTPSKELALAIAHTENLIANLALGHVGSAQRIGALETERSVEAEQIRLFIVFDIRHVLENFAWPEATSYAPLQLVAESPSEDWAYAYRYPGRCLLVRRIVTALGRRDPNPPPFRVGRDEEGKLVYTDQPQATVEFTYDLQDITAFSPGLVNAISWKLAGSIAPTISKIKNVLEIVTVGFDKAIRQAQVKAARESQHHPEPDPDHIRARE